MIKYFFPNKFERTQHPHLPPKASKILHNVVTEFRSTARSAKHHEMAQANLHMRLYQQFGHEASQIMPDATKQLRDLLGPKAAL